MRKYLNEVNRPLKNKTSLMLLNFNSNKKFIKLQIAIVLVMDMLRKFMELNGPSDSKIEIIFKLCKETIMRFETLQSLLFRFEIFIKVLFKVRF